MVNAKSIDEPIFKDPPILGDLAAGADTYILSKVILVSNNFFLSRSQL